MIKQSPPAALRERRAAPEGLAELYIARTADMLKVDYD